VTTACPCGRGGALGALPYERCCGRYLDDPTTPAPDPESLMRSRYTAYARSRSDYVLATWDAARRPRALDLDPGMRWTGLTVLDSAEDGDTGRVRFEARYTDPRGRDGVLHENSRFVRRDGHWFYLDGDPR